MNASVRSRLSLVSLCPATTVAVAGGALVTLLITVSPLEFAYKNLSLHVALETGEGLIGGLLAYLAVQRFRARGRLRDVVLAGSFALLAVTNLLFSAAPIVALESRPHGTLTWVVAGLRLCGAGGLCASAYVSRGEATTRQLRRIAGGTAVVLCLVVLAAVAAGAWLPDAVDPLLAPEASRWPRLVGHPVVLGIQVVAMMLFAAAALGFDREARRGEDERMGWLAAGAALAAFARVNFFLFPSLYSNWVYTGDLLRLASYLLFLIGAIREIDTYRQDQTRLAVMEERRRMARDLHDGLVQELSFIRSQTAAMADGGVQVPGMAPLVAKAADRALHESRRAIEALAGEGSESLAAALRHAAEEIAERAGIAVKVDVDDVPDLSARVREALAWVVREATSNAVRHAQATLVSLELRSEDGGLRMVVADDGAGFSVGAATGSGFGLRSMRQRVENLGGHLAVRSEPGHGTHVEVTLPGSAKVRRHPRREK